MELLLQQGLWINNIIILKQNIFIRSKHFIRSMQVTTLLFRDETSLFGECTIRSLQAIELIRMSFLFLLLFVFLFVFLFLFLFLFLSTFRITPRFAGLNKGHPPPWPQTKKEKTKNRRPKIENQK